MKQKLLALAAVVSAAVAGAIVAVNWDTGTVSNFPPGGFEFIDKSACTVAACGANACTQADNILADAGSSCSTRLFSCDVRVGQRARDWASDAGLSLGPANYQRLRFVGLRCPVDGGSAFGIPVDDLGLPQFASVTSLNPLCKRAPRDGGGTCNRDEHDGGVRYFGAGNVMPSAEAIGPDCEPVGCTVFFGDDPNVDL